jgi:FSR family fosmidomycin resistance protein-like MFS transporter
MAPEHKASIGAFLMGMVWCVSEAIGQCGGGVLTTFFSDDAPAKALEVIGALFLVGLLAAARLPQETKEQKKETIVLAS